MGACVSTCGRSSCDSRIKEEAVPPYCVDAALFGQVGAKIVSGYERTVQHSQNWFSSNGISQTSCLFTQQGRKGVNQDAMIVWEDFLSEGVTFCGVFDGHGPQGHHVAGNVRDALPLKLMSALVNLSRQRNRAAQACFNGKKLLVEESEDALVEDKLKLLWREAFMKSYKAMDKELKWHQSLDCFCSGSTAVTIVKQDSNLFIGNIGDSRAIMGSKDENDELVAIQLTVDLKPNLPREAERISKCKGRVFALQDEPEVARVWLPFDDAPGLAMARAFGDFCLKDYGVISVPEFSHRTLTEQDLFIVLASDGVWDVLSNKEVVEIVSSAPSRTLAARILVKLAMHEWQSKYPTSKMDDCAVVCLFLDGKVDATVKHDPLGLPSAFLTNHGGAAAAAAAAAAATAAAAAATAAGGGGGVNELVKLEKGSEPCLRRNFTVRSMAPAGVGEEAEIEEEQSWISLEGISRVDSLVQFPRFPCST